jgi:ABC-type nitrate/sulfonate/bicarbonate transport system permease component
MLIRARPLLIGSASLATGMVIWELSARLLANPVTLPQLSRIGRQAIDTFLDGTLEANVGASLFRIFAGFALGSALGMLLGLAMGMLTWVRRFLDPIVNFLRFIPPIAWISPFLIWFGIGETSKVLLITYTVTFMVVLNTMAGIYAIPRNRIRAARSMGASQLQIFRWVVVPSVVAYILTGMRIGMANAFTTIVTAEMIAAQAGLGFLILVSKNYGATDLIMLGMIMLGVLGLLTDRLFVAATGRFARRFYLH